jgi:hypothetical protein
MATSVETRLDRVEDRLAEVVELLNGGPNVSWDRSVRGRLHFLQNQDSARTLRDSDRARRFTRTEVFAGLVFAGLQTALMVATLFVASGH